MFSKFFITRPVLSSVISIIIVLAGIMSMTNLAIEQYPPIIPPEVTVSAIYPGASAEVISKTVADPLEQQINGADNMIYLRSVASNSGQLSINITFEVGTDIDEATIDVNNRVQAAIAKLPQEVQRVGVTVRKRSSSILQVITLYSPNNKYDPIYISNYALLNILDDLKRVPGIGNASLFGAKDYAMRIWFDPTKLNYHNLTTDDVAQAIKEQNSQYSIGQLGQEPLEKPQQFTYSISTQGRLSTVKEFEDIIIRADQSGNILKLKDIAKVELGAQDYSFNAKFDGKPAVAIGINLQPGANALKAADAVRKKMEELQKSFPEQIAYSIPVDITSFVKISIREVIYTFIEAMILVTLVVFIFLQNAKATLIPIIAVPVSIIGTFAGMYFLGFSINLLTLFGLVLAIGIVVDDAIVVLENVERIMKEENLSAKDAAIKSMSQVTGPIVTIVLVLCAVFIPVAFIGGLTGEMYKQFAITISISVIISGVVALTLTPALCAIILNSKPHQSNKFFNWFNNFFDSLTHKYIHGVNFLIKRSAIGIMIFVGMLVISGGLFLHLPTSLVPEEDQGYNFIISSLLPATSLSRTQHIMDMNDQKLMKLDEVQNIVTFAGFDLVAGSTKSNAGVTFVRLKDWDQRQRPDQDARNLVKKFMGLGANVKDAFIFAINPPPISGMSTTGGFEAYVQDRTGGSSIKLAEVSNMLISEAAKSPKLMGVRNNFVVNVPQYFVTIDKVKAKALNISINSIYNVLNSCLGGIYVNDFNIFGRNYQVNLQAHSNFRDKLESLKYLHVRSADNKLYNVDSLIKSERIIGADLLERFNSFPSARIMGGAASGFSSGEALIEIENIAKKILPVGYNIAWTGEAYQEKISSSSSYLAFIFGIIMVFLILAAQYENWSLPLSVIMAVPFAVFGALMAIWLRGLNNDVYFQIGLVTLIALAAKNAILIVEFAISKHKEDGLQIIDAVIFAARQRFRPIIMTSLAFIFGCIPLAISSGAGSASRHSLGTGIIGGMCGATFIAIFFIPLFFKLIAKKKLSVDN